MIIRHIIVKKNKPGTLRSLRCKNSPDLSTESPC